MFDKWKTRRSQEPSHDVPAILAIACSLSDREALQQIVEKMGWEMASAEDLDRGAELLRAKPIPIVVCDRDLPGMDWREAIRTLAAGVDRRCVILASFVADDYLWEEVIHHGGYDILPKPFREDEVIHAIRFAWAAVSKNAGALTKSRPSSLRTE